MEQYQLSMYRNGVKIYLIHQQKKAILKLGWFALAFTKLKTVFFLWIFGKNSGVNLRSPVENLILLGLCFSIFHDFFMICFVVWNRNLLLHNIMCGCVSLYSDNHISTHQPKRIFFQEPHGLKFSFFLFVFVHVYGFWRNSIHFQRSSIFWIQMIYNIYTIHPFIWLPKNKCIAFCLFWEVGKSEVIPDIHKQDYFYGFCV